MGVTGAIVVYALLWFICLLIIMPRGQPTQAEVGHVEPGTPSGAPSTLNIQRKLLLTTIVATVIWLIIFLIVSFDVITLDDLDFLSPASLRRGDG